MLVKTYRPYLTYRELQFMISLLEQTSLTLGMSTHPNLISLLNKLRVFDFKITSEMVKPAHTAQTKLTTLEKLGGTSPEESKYLSGEMTPEEELNYTSKLMENPNT